MNELGWSKRASGVCVLSVVMTVVSPTRFTTLVNFNGTDGEYPVYESLVQGLDGDLYGTTQFGGTENCGTVFKITPGGALTSLFSSNCANAHDFSTPLVLGSAGNFYGVTDYGGTKNEGVVFKITPNGVVTTLHNFDGLDGAIPDAALILGIDGNFYGTTSAGGGAYGYGTVFKITPNGTVITIHSFNYADGSDPVAALALGSDGDFYGTTQEGGQGGANGYGTIFKITPSGVFTSLHRFDFVDGSTPTAAVVQGADGNFYGTTYNGGANNEGTVFRITSDGTRTTLHSFDGTDGTDVVAPLIQATDGNFYGTTSLGGMIGSGTVFKITPGGTLTTLHDFSFTDGSSVFGGLVQATDGNFYGTTNYGGANLFGTIYRLSVGLGPFVEIQPTSARVGAGVKILGTKLTGATSVRFNATATTFKVISSSLISTTVPAGATSGKVQVTTPSRVLTSNVVFRVVR